MRHHPNFEQAVVDHYAVLDRTLCDALTCWQEQGGGADAVVFDAGCVGHYPRDDQSPPFRACPHAARFVPEPGPDDLILARPGEPVHWIRVVPKDYWHEPRGLPHHPAVERCKVTEVATRAAAEELIRSATANARVAYVGPQGARADALGISEDSVEPRALVAALDFGRAHKTTYEVGCIREAVSKAARGHRAVAEAVARRPSEYALQMAYLGAAELMEHQLPYPSIIAWDDRCAVLHYQSSRHTEPDPGSSLLIDAGASAWGYACDVTRTYVDDSFAPMVRLYAGMQELQADLSESAEPGTSFVALHRRALAGIADLLSEIGALTASPAEAVEKGWMDLFMPHGLGHMLGLRVHDAAGQQVSARGEVSPAPEAWPYLRTTVNLEPGHVVTIEPGVYFMPSQLQELRATARGAFDFGLLRQLEEFGGIRIEDDIWITAQGPVNLSRSAIP